MAGSASGSRWASLKEEAWRANLEIPRQGLALYTWGNVSALDPDAGVFAIKPSGVPYSELTADDLVVIDMDGEKVEGSLNPSSDTPTHLELYRAFASSGVRGIIHTHSTHAVAWAQACMGIPLFGTTHADHVQVPVPCTRLLSKEAVENDYEKETGKLIVEHFVAAGFKAEEVNMVLVGGHGPFAWGPSAAKAVYNGAVLEEVARMASLTLEINPSAKELPDYIVSKHYERKHGPKAYYGQG